MIDNLRYYLNGGKIMVKWNWIGVNDNVVARCRLLKRLNGDEITTVNGITLVAYRADYSGCTIALPQVPTRIEVTDNQGGSASVDVLEAPPYEIQLRCSLRSKPRGILMRTEHHYMSIHYSLPDTLLDDEISQIEGWILSCVKQSSRQRFFLPRLRQRESTFGPFEITEADAKDKYEFEVVPEVAGTRFDHMFSLSASEAKQASDEANPEYGEVLFDRLKRDTLEENGFYKSRCPYCFGEISFDRPVFRAKVGRDATLGFQREPDEKYVNFARLMNVTDDQPRGHVLLWDSEDIRSVFYANVPNQEVPYEAGKPLEDVVLAVRDKFGNLTNEKLCPHCHHSIPAMTGKYPNVFISMLGNSGSGKTVYLASMINMLKSGAMFPGYAFNCSVCENTRSREIRRVYETLFKGNLPGEEAPAPIEAPAVTSAAAPIQPQVPVELPRDEYAMEFDDFSFGGLTPEGGPGDMPPVDAPLNPVEPVDPFAPGDIADPFAPGDVAPSFAPGDVDASLPMGGSGKTYTSSGSGSFFVPDDKLNRDVTHPKLQFPALDEAELAGLGDIPVGAPQESLQEDQLIVDDDSLQIEENVPAERRVHNQLHLPRPTERVYMEPCIYELTGKNPETEEDVGVILSFFDFPGEAIRANVGEQLSANDQYLIQMIELADGLIFLFDPSSIERVRNMGKETRSGFLKYTLSGVQENWDTIQNQSPAMILEEFQRKFIVNAYKRLDKPVTMVLSKADAIRDYLKRVDEGMGDVDTFFLDESVHARAQDRISINVSELRRASDAIVQFMDDTNLNNACRQLMQNDGNYIWVCVSATGIAPDSEGTLYQRHGVPVHVLDPVEWILYRQSLRDSETANS